MIKTETNFKEISLVNLLGILETWKSMLRFHRLAIGEYWYRVDEMGYNLCKHPDLELELYERSKHKGIPVIEVTSFLRELRKAFLDVMEKDLLDNKRAKNSEGAEK